MSAPAIQQMLISSSGTAEVTPGAFDYLRPDGSSYYKRPDGTSYYTRP